MSSNKLPQSAMPLDLIKTRILYWCLRLHWTNLFGKNALTCETCTTLKVRREVSWIHNLMVTLRGLACNIKKNFFLAAASEWKYFWKKNSHVMFSETTKKGERREGPLVNSWHTYDEMSRWSITKRFCFRSRKRRRKYSWNCFCKLMLDEVTIN